MWLLPHAPDSTCANGRRHGAVPELRTNGHFPHDCTRRSASAALVASTYGSAGPGTHLAAITAIPHDGTTARDRHARLWSQRRTAAKARSGPATPEHDVEYSHRPDTVVFASGITRSNAEFSFARCACRALGKWTA
jgi:hypothetical protein